MSSKNNLYPKTQKAMKTLKDAFVPNNERSTLRYNNFVIDLKTGKATDTKAKEYKPRLKENFKTGEFYDPFAEPVKTPKPSKVAPVAPVEVAPVVEVVEATAPVEAVPAGKVIVNQLDMDGKFLKGFTSYAEIAKALNKDDVSHVRKVCKGTRPSAYGFKWENAKTEETSK